MPRTTLTPGIEIASRLPEDWASATDADKLQIKSGLHEVLHDMSCRCNGEAKALNSVATTIRERIRGQAISRRVELGIRELAQDRGVDLAVASPSAITTSVSAEEISSLMAFEASISQETINQVVTNAEMAAIESEEIGRSRAIRDPAWDRDLSQLVARCVPHAIVEINAAGLSAVVTVAIKLDTLIAEVDDNGEVCCWMYEES